MKGACLYVYPSIRLRFFSKFTADELSPASRVRNLVINIHVENKIVLFTALMILSKEMPLAPTPSFPNLSNYFGECTLLKLHLSSCELS